MEFVTYHQPADAAAAIQDYMRSTAGRKLPKDIQEQVWEFLRPGGSVSFAVAYFAELVFARKEEIDDNEALRLAASCAAHGATYHIDNLGGARGAGIMQALRRRSGEKAPTGLTWPAAKDDPEPRVQFVKAEPPAPIQPPIEPPPLPGPDAASSARRPAAGAERKSGRK
jgi:hypothetical protein